LNNFHRGVYSNILTGTRGKMYGISGSNSLCLRLTSGSAARGTFFEKLITASQHSVGQNFISGVYSASFCVSQFTGTNPPNKGEIRFNSALADEIKNAGSATFTEIWSSLDQTVAFLTGSLVVNTVNRSSFSNQAKRLLTSITNMKDEFGIDDKYRFRVFVDDIDRPIRYKKVPFVTPSSIFDRMFYQIKDFKSGKIVIPFDTEYNSTLLSTDKDGMYFDIYMDTLFKGTVFTVDFLIKTNGTDLIFTDVAAKFRVV